MLNIQGGEVVLLVLLALLVLGPSRLPHYAARLAQMVRQLRDLAEGAKSQMRTEMGPAFEDIDWRQLDPRQYDPRRIVREALASPSADGTAGAGEARPATSPPSRPAADPATHDPSLPTPFDVDAT